MGLWNDDNYRPDKTAKTWNELYSKQDSETQKRMVTAFSDTNKLDLELLASASMLGLRAKGGFSTNVKIDFSKTEEMSKEEINMKDSCVRPQYSGAVLALLITFFNYLVRMTLTVLLIAQIGKSFCFLLSAVNRFSVQRYRLSSKEELRSMKTLILP